MKLHKHLGVIQALDETVLKEVLSMSALQHKVLGYLAPNIAVLEREDAVEATRVLKESNIHPRVIGLRNRS